MKILHEQDIQRVAAQERSTGNRIVLTGGVFDIVHPGHIHFLKGAKSLGDKLFILLESDENVKKFKGINRPINTQRIRARVLSDLPFTDYIILLEGVTKSSEYDKLIVQIVPDVIALTKGDPGTAQRRKQSEMIGAKLEEIGRLDTASTTDLIKNGKV